MSETRLGRLPRRHVNADEIPAYGRSSAILHRVRPEPFGSPANPCPVSGTLPTNRRSPMEISCCRLLPHRCT